MAKTAAKISTINRSTPGAHLDLSSYGRDVADWPRSWMGFEKDLPPGEKLVACFELDRILADLQAEVMPWLPPERTFAGSRRESTHAPALPATIGANSFSCSSQSTTCAIPRILFSVIRS